jgi:hypothetical protein
MIPVGVAFDWMPQCGADVADARRVCAGVR